MGRYGKYELVIIDEAQRAADIGLKLKILADNFPDQQIIATESSSFDLNNRLSEPLTGRSIDFWLYPLSVSEIRDADKPSWEFADELENLLVFGNYPAVITANSREDKKQTINQITSKYLYQDILQFENMRNSEKIRSLLEALALQIGQEVSFTELGRLLRIDAKTAERHVEILEK